MPRRSIFSRMGLGQRLGRFRAWAVCFVAAAGCGNELPGKLTAQLSAAEAPVRLLPCTDLLLALEPVDAPDGLDYIGVFSAFYSTQHRNLVGDHGEPCRSAQDRSSCMKALEWAIDSAPVCEPGAAACKPVVVTTREDEIIAHTTAESLRSVLGDVNTASEAALFAQLYGFQLVCAPEHPRASNAGTLVQATGTGFRLQSRWLVCDGSTGGQAIEIHDDGSSDDMDPYVATGQGPCTGTTGGSTRR